MKGRKKVSIVMFLIILVLIAVSCVIFDSSYRKDFHEQDEPVISKAPVGKMTPKISVITKKITEVKPLAVITEINVVPTVTQKSEVKPQKTPTEKTEAGKKPHQTITVKTEEKIKPGHTVTAKIEAEEKPKHTITVMPPSTKIITEIHACSHPNRIPEYETVKIEAEGEWVSVPSYKEVLICGCGLTENDFESLSGFYLHCYENDESYSLSMVLSDEYHSEWIETVPAQEYEKEVGWICPDCGYKEKY